ncbi:MAG: N-acyl homoserine lactonase family protein [Novosphingobium sp.]|nr:N-acyl homoserine lactonase family protein [Novosphingobium sp.]
MTPATDIRRLFVLLCGYEILPKTISTRGQGARFILSEPVCAYLLDTASGWVLLDAGMNPENITDPARREAAFGRHGMTPPVIRAPHRLETQLDQIGVRFADIGHVILSHLHFDHCGYLGHLRHARISVQRREHAQAFEADPGVAYIRSDYDDPAIRWDLRDGDWSAMPGLHLLDTHGHTDGHQSALLHLPGTGPILLPFDAGDLRENFTQELLPGECRDEHAALAAIRRLKRLEHDLGASMLLFHDPVEIQQMRLAPEYYD